MICIDKITLQKFYDCTFFSNCRVTLSVRTIYIRSSFVTCIYRFFHRPPYEHIMEKKSFATSTSTPNFSTTSTVPLTDGRYDYEKQCTPLACAFEHCFQQHKYQMVPACVTKLNLYNECVELAKSKQKEKQSGSLPKT